MKLWILRPIDEKTILDASNPDSRRWSWDCAWGFVVRARDEQSARKHAADECGDEGEGAWLDPGLTSCVPLAGKGAAGVVMKDFLSG